MTTDDRTLVSPVRIHLDPDANINLEIYRDGGATLVEILQARELTVLDQFEKASEVYWQGDGGASDPGVFFFWSASTNE